MSCKYSDICGGCSLRDMDEKSYKNFKEQEFKKIVEKINQADVKIGDSVFIQDGQRRRATLAFCFKKGKLTLGFNTNKSSDIIDIENCHLLTPKINHNLPNIRRLLNELCQTKITKRVKNKITTESVSKGDISICEVDNGLDLVLEFDADLNFDYRMIISEFINNYADIIRISHRRAAFSATETIVDKIKPFINIGGYEVYVPAGTFLQASKEAENKLVALVQKYLNGVEGKIADLFCGVGTFSYPLSQNPKNKILSIDNSQELLDGFRYSINKNMITNIEIINKNLFKYPLDEGELKDVKAIVIDPPRAGAFEQMKQIKEVPKVVAVSCNPHSFIKDANMLISNGYHLDEITLVDQFLYSNHSELVALFTKL